jgi:hypothetical protein
MASEVHLGQVVLRNLHRVVGGKNKNLNQHQTPASKVLQNRTGKEKKEQNNKQQHKLRTEESTG